MSKSPDPVLGLEVEPPKIDWEVLFWKLAALLSMGWYDEALRLVSTVAMMPPLVVKDDPSKKN